MTCVSPSCSDVLPITPEQLQRAWIDTREGLRLRAWLSPANDRTLLVFRHGNGLPALTYWPVLSRLYAQFDLLLIDAQGHGESDRGQHFVGWERSAEQVTAFLQQHKLQRGVPLVGMGHSFGSVLTALSAAAHPTLYDALVMLDPVLLPPIAGVLQRNALGRWLWQQQPLAKQARARRTQWQDREQAFRYFYNRGVFRGWHDDAVHAYVDHGTVVQNGRRELRSSHHIESQIFGSYPRRGIEAFFQLQPPTRIFYGTDTYAFIAPRVKAVCARNPAVSARQVAGGHCFMLESPQQCAHDVQDFLAGIGSLGLAFAL